MISVEISTVSQLNNSIQSRSTVSPSEPSPVNSSSLNSVYQDKVTLSPQAQFVQKTGEDNQQRQDNLDAGQANQTQTSSNDFVRISSTIGKVASSGSLSEAEAVKLYRQIEQLI